MLLPEEATAEACHSRNGVGPIEIILLGKDRAALLIEGGEQQILDLLIGERFLADRPEVSMNADLGRHSGTDMKIRPLDF